MRKTAAEMNRMISDHGFDEVVRTLSPEEVPEFIEAAWAKLRADSEAIDNTTVMVLDKLDKKAAKDATS